MVAKLAARSLNQHVIRATKLADADDWSFAHLDDNSVAYLLFTSGSTGQPKGRDDFSPKLSRNQGVRMGVGKGPTIGHAVYCAG